MQEYLKDIAEHFKDSYPREGCGLLGVVKGKLKWFPCENIATNEDDFVMDSTQYLEISRKANIVGIVHSHPNRSPEPSITDINYCNALGIKYYIFSYPEMKMHILEPENNTVDLHGRVYEFGKYDCLEAGIDYYKHIGIELPKRIPFESNWWEKNLNYFTDEYIKTWGFYKVDGNMKQNDLIIFTIRSVVPNHCAVYLGNDIIYHHAENRLSCNENIYPFWKQHVTGVYRYAS